MWLQRPPPDVEWSSSFHVGDWIRDHLHPFGRDIGSVIPDCFDAHIAILHADRRHELSQEALRRLSDILVQHTTTPEHIWYCIWEGYAWLHGGSAVSGNPAGLVPTTVRDDGRFHLPSRDYYLYRGDISTAAVFVPEPWDLRPNLWWPEDRSWCVATEIYSICTYVGGTGDLSALLADAIRGVTSVSPDEPFQEGRDYTWPSHNL